MKLFFTFLLVFLVSFEGQAIETFLGRVSLIKGKVFRTNKKDKNQVPLKKGDKVYEGDKIETQERSIVKLKLVDDSLITIAPNSNFLLDTFNFSTKSDRSAIFKLLKGQIRSNIPIKARPKALRYESKTAALAVRGTVFLMNVHDDKYDNSVTEYAVVEGEVEVLNKLKKSYEVGKKGDRIIVLNNKKGLSKNVKKKLSKNTFTALNSIDDIKSMDTNQFMKAFEGQVLTKASIKNEDKKINYRPKRTPEDFENKIQRLNKTRKENQAEEES